MEPDGGYGYAVLTMAEQQRMKRREGHSKNRRTEVDTVIVAILPWCFGGTDHE